VNRLKISELVEQSGVPLSTIKFYLREGLVSPGERRSPNQARYGPSHLERLRLIRALREVAGLSLEAVKAVIRELDRGWDDGDPVGEALHASLALSPVQANSTTQEEVEETTQEVLEFLGGLDWTSMEHTRHLFADTIATSLVQVRRYLSPDIPVEVLAPYARVAWLLSEIEFAQSPDGPRVPMEGDDLTDPTRRAVLGSILFGRIVAALRNAANAMRSIRTTAGLPLPRAAVLASDRRPPKR
jgi:DNA-binding transcriptional MerR regulator